MEALKTDYTVTYDQKDITESVVSKYLINMTYSDKTEGESDELALTFEDTDELWAHFWYPRKGDKLSATIGSLNCGEFEIDDISYNISPATITIRALAASFINKKLRTKRSAAHENKNLTQIVNYYASLDGLTPLLNIRKDIIIERETQNNVTDLAFLKALADKYGYVFSVRGEQLLFWDIFALEAAEPVIELSRTDLKSGTFNDKVSEIYSDCTLSYQNPDSDSLVSVTVKSTIVTQSADTLELKQKAENKGQAEEIAKSVLYKKNTEKVTASFNLQGNELLVAGINLRITDQGNFEGVYHVKQSTHKIDNAGGYTTGIEIKKVQDA